MKFSIIGSGFIFPAHVEAIRSVNGQIREVVNTTYGENNYKLMLRNTDADCIVILSPNDLHFPMITEAVSYGKTVLVEKPAVITTDQAMELLDTPNVFSVLQLRHHPALSDLKKLVGEKFSEITMDISVYRDEKYYASWKGQNARSGGVAFNLGIHYFDTLLHVFGPAREITVAYQNDKTVEGRIRGKRYACNFRVSTDEPQSSQRRVFTVNGQTINFSSKDNLSFENLHRFVYQDLVQGRGTTIADALPVIELIERINHDSTVHENLALH